MIASVPEEQRRRNQRFLLSAGIVVLLGLADLLSRPVLDVVWGVTHHFRASNGAVSVELPWGWRQDELKGSQHRLVLRNSLREVLRFRAPDEITLRDFETHFDAVEMAQQWERLETRRMVPGERLEPTPKDSFLRANYRCADIKRSADLRITLTCFDLAGRWVVSLQGRSRSIRDLSAIMQSAQPTAEATP